MIPPPAASLPVPAPGAGSDGIRGDSSRYPALDGLRGIAVLVVIVHNAAYIASSGTSLPTKLFLAATSVGWTGVQLFFVLSGFLITGLLLDARGTPDYYRTFYLRRTLRIFPLYYAFLACAVFVVPLSGASPEWVATMRAHQGWYWTYLSNWAVPLGRDVPGLSHLWSLAVEEQFYLAWPVVVASLSLTGLRRVCLTLLLITPLIRLALATSGLPAVAAYEFTVARWDALAAGALLALLIREAARRELLERFLPAAAFVSAAMLAALIAVQRGFHADELPVQVVGQSLVAILSAILVAVAVIPTGGWGGAMRGVLSHGVLRTLGKYSYGMYVLHFPIQLLGATTFRAIVNGPDGPWRLGRVLLYLVVVLAATFLVALVSWRLLERPFLELKERIAPRHTASLG